MKSTRFVLLIGDYQDVYPDIPAGLPVGYYDRDERVMALTFSHKYAQLICLETAGVAPFTDLENWLNDLSPDEIGEVV